MVLWIATGNNPRAGPVSVPSSGFVHRLHSWLYSKQHLSFHRSLVVQYCLDLCIRGWLHHLRKGQPSAEAYDGRLQAGEDQEVAGGGRP